MKNIIYILIILLGLGSCTIQENIHFHDDFSGSTSIVMDFKAMFEMIPEDSLKNLDDSEMAITLEEIKQQYSEIDGISNFNYKMDIQNGYISFSFDFDHLDALNATYEVDQMGDDMFFSDQPVRKQFTGKKNKLTVELISDENSMESMDEMTKAMLAMFEAEQYYTFDSKIKKLKTKNLEFERGDGKNSIIMDGTLEDLISSDKGSRKCTVTLNKKK